MLVNDQKVFFKARGPQGRRAAQLKFTTDFALKEGNNNVLVVARESTGLRQPPHAGHPPPSGGGGPEGGRAHAGATTPGKPRHSRP